MISSIRGTLIDATPESLCVEAQGVGYELNCSLTAIAEMQSHLGKPVFLQVYTHVREDAIQLFGFLDKPEKQMFLSLLKVNGVGPKMAMNILSGSSLTGIQQMIESEDVKALSKLPKVGKKTAEQMILTLKGKLVVAADKNSKKAEGFSVPLVGVKKDIASALVNLGFKNQDVDKVIQGFAKDLTFEEGVRQGLQQLSSL